MKPKIIHQEEEDVNDPLEIKKNSYLDIPSQEVPIRSSISSPNNQMSNDSSNRSDSKLLNKDLKVHKSRESVVRIRN